MNIGYIIYVCITILICLCASVYTHLECKKMYEDWIKELEKRDRNRL